MTGESKPAADGASALLSSSAKGLCPHCGARTLFVSPVRFADRCDACGLDYTQFNVGDGPAAFLTLIIGGIVLVLALVVEFSFRPPLWVHLLLWPPITIGATVGSLRVAKAMLLTLEHRNAAREGRLAVSPTDMKPNDTKTKDPA